MKKLTVILICVAMCIAMAACGGSSELAATDAIAAFEPVPLTEEEAGLIEMMGADVNHISDEEYISAVSEIIYHSTAFSGQVFQVEGYLLIDGESMSLYRNLVHGEETMQLGLPLRYLEKEISSGAWVRVTGIVSAEEVEGQMVSFLDIAAIEGLAEVGQADLEWDGGSTHHH